MTGKQSRVGFWANADKLNWSDFFHKLLLLLLLTRMRRRSKQPLQLPPPHSHGIISITPISVRLGGFGRKQAFYNFPPSSRYRATRHPTYPPQHSELKEDTSFLWLHWKSQIGTSSADSCTLVQDFFPNQFLALSIFTEVIHCVLCEVILKNFGFSVK